MPKAFKISIFMFYQNYRLNMSFRSLAILIRHKINIRPTFDIIESLNVYIAQFCKSKEIYYSYLLTSEKSIVGYPCQLLVNPVCPAL